ncbi:VanW family protein [Cellulomonas sp. JH27-2]|uniref:VanW family protein n=1 Tax=Cellulomonas sp. JH27-2 TaxID=2774139 RepID=UPI0017822157|nr:VanW family protein [Cellulomonas sp. JH27-2]MBD8059715.1 VanW family protein [Cellulomonas sp. JH27-2]
MSDGNDRDSGTPADEVPADEPTVPSPDGSDEPGSDEPSSDGDAADAVWPVWGGTSPRTATQDDAPAVDDTSSTSDEPAEQPADEPGDESADEPGDESADEPAQDESAPDEGAADGPAGEPAADDAPDAADAPDVPEADDAPEGDAAPGEPAPPGAEADGAAAAEVVTDEDVPDDGESAARAASPVQQEEDEPTATTDATELIAPVTTATPTATPTAATPAEPVHRHAHAAEPAAAAGAATGAAAAGAAAAAGDASQQPPVPARHRVIPGDTTAPAPTPATVSAGPVPTTPRKESPLDVFDADDGKRRWPRRLAVVGGIVVVLIGGYVAASYALGDKVPRGATVAGVDIGGLSSSDAVTRLDDELGDATSKKIPVVAKEVTASLDPQDAGLTFDAQATVDQLTGVDLLEPARLWDHVVGTGEVDPVTSVDAKELGRSVDALSPALSKTPVDGTVVFVDGSAQATKAADGWKLDTVKASKVVADDWLVGARPLELPTSAVAPDITQDETDASLATAEKVVSAPVSVTVDGKLTVLTADDLSAAASMVPKDGNLVLQLDGEKLTKEILDQQPDLETKASDASFVFVDDKPKIKAGKPGKTLDPDDVAAAVSKAAVADERDATVELTKSDPVESTAELKKLRVDEIVSEFSTPLTPEPKRTENIRVGLSHITGTLIRPGETFSLTEALGPVDAKHGFIDAGAIVSGEHVQAVGGGLSQVSTTTYNAAFFAGMEDITHQPHSEWFSRYPEGRESTIFTGVIDMAWKNTTPYGALVQGWVADGRAYVRIWGTKYWTVKTTTSARSGVVAPTTVYSESKTCEPALPGNPGFSVTVTRKIYLKDELKKTESNSWRYKPQNRVICGAPPSSDDKDGDSGGTDD